jgi:HK97 gp10 family phage protein
LTGFSFDTSSFKGGRELNTKINRAVKAVMEFNDGPAEEHMKHFAPWTDRTTNARNGLGAKAKSQGNHHAIVLFHSVDYGIYLEEGTQYMEPRPIILPTIALFGPKVQAMLAGLFDRLGGV